jgi:hypothetical protein
VAFIGKCLLEISRPKKIIKEKKKDLPEVKK